MDVERIGLEPEKAHDENELEMAEGLIARNLKNGWRDVPERDKAFATEYLTNGYDYRAAAEAVGLARSSGLRKLRAPLVRAFIGYLQEKSANVQLITKDFVEQQYLEILPKLKGEVPVQLVTPQGESYSAPKFHSGEVVSVLRDLGKAAGYAPEEKQGGGTVHVEINMGDFTGDTPVTIDVKAEDDGS